MDKYSKQFFNEGISLGVLKGEGMGSEMARDLFRRKLLYFSGIFIAASNGNPTQNSF